MVCLIDDVLICKLGLNVWDIALSWYTLCARCILERCGESVAPRAGGVFVQSTLAGSPAETRSIHP